MKLSELELKMMAKEATANFLDKNIPLNDSVIKIASERKLNPHQIARVCEMANVDTYHNLWTKTGSGNFTFDVADQEKVASHIDKTAAYIPDEYVLPPSAISKLASRKIEVEQPGEREKLAGYDKLLMADPPAGVSRRHIFKLMNKLAYYVGELDSAIFETQVSIKEAESKLVDVFKRAALRGENIAPVFAAAVVARPEKTAAVKLVLAGVSNQLKKHGISLEKHAAQCCTEDSTGKCKDEGDVIRTNSAVMKHIDTIIGHKEQIPHAENARVYLVKKVESLKGKVTDKSYDNDDE